MIALLADVEEQSCSDIVRLISEAVEMVEGIAIGLEILNKSTNQFNEISDISVFFRIDNLFKDLFGWTFFQLKTMV